jgi:hypothetical protein
MKNESDSQHVYHSTNELKVHSRTDILIHINEIIFLKKIISDVHSVYHSTGL